MKLRKAVSKAFDRAFGVMSAQECDYSRVRCTYPDDWQFDDDSGPDLPEPPLTADEIKTLYGYELSAYGSKRHD